MVNYKMKEFRVKLPPHLVKKASYLANEFKYPYQADAIRFAIDFTANNFIAKKEKKKDSAQPL